MSGAHGSHLREGERMDILYIGLAVAFFGLSWALVVACERLG
jgi:hypothetical protein